MAALWKFPVFFPTRRPLLMPRSSLCHKQRPTEAFEVCPPLCQGQLFEAVDKATLWELLFL
jgi:hypothetical protein